MNQLLPIICLIPIVGIWILIEVKATLWIRIASLLVASFLIWNITWIGVSVIPSKEKGMNAASFHKIEQMIAEGQEEEAFHALRTYLSEYQSDHYKAALSLNHSVFPHLQNHNQSGDGQ